MKVANIVFDGEINEVNAKLVNFVSGVENDSLPTLIIGWDIAQGYDVKITNHHIGEKLWWTFSPLERRSIYLKDVSKFVGHAGIDLKVIDLIGFKRESLIKKVKEIAEIYSDDGEVHERYKEYLDYIHDDPKYIPYFMYLENGRR